MLNMVLYPLRHIGKAKCKVLKRVNDFCYSRYTVTFSVEAMKSSRIPYEEELM